MLSDFRFALRTLAKTPVISIVAVLSLALGIGANTAIFSLFHQILLKDLPVDDAGRLVNIKDDGPKSGSESNNQSGRSEYTFSYPMLRDLEKLQGKVFESLAGHRYFGANVAFRGQTSSSSGILVSGNFFQTYRLKPELGRLIQPSDDDAPGAHAVAVLGYEYWNRKLGGAKDVLNEKMVINGKPVTIIGVAPQSFRGVTIGSNPDFYAPISMREALTPGWTGLAQRANYWLYLSARLMPGMDIQQAQTAVNVTYRGIIQEVEAKAQESRSTTYMERFRKKSLTLEAGAQGYGQVRVVGRMPLIFLLCITGFVLIIACANIANLLLARAANRAREISIRLSVGASRWRLIRQLLAESISLGLLGGLLGLIVARWTLYLLVSMMPDDPTGNTFTETLEAPALLFALALSIGTGLIFGVFPALHSTRPDLAGVLKDQAGQVSATGAAARFRRVLVTAQFAISLLLLICAGLFVRSLVNVARTDLGIKTDHVVVFGLSPELSGYNVTRSMQLFEKLEDTLAALPGVTDVGVSMIALVADNNWGTSVRVDGFEATPDTNIQSMYNEAGPGVFSTLGIPLLAGRAFTRADNLTSPKVAIVNEAFLRKFKLASPANAIGKHMSQDDNKKLDIEIVGVIKDSKYSDVKAVPPPVFYRPYRQNKYFGAAAIYVRTALDPAVIMPLIRKTVAEQDPQLPVEDMKTLERQVKENVLMDRMIATQSAAFAVLATLLAAIGLYGVLAYSVARRTREIGIRLALGAEGSSVRNMILKEVSAMAAAGIAIGAPAAFVLSKSLASLLYGMEARDPLVFAACIVGLLGVALLAGYVPALRATRIDPMNALRYE